MRIDLGVRIRKDMIGEEYKGLKPCGPAPNCFCSTDNIEDDPDHYIPSWKWPSASSRVMPFYSWRKPLTHTNQDRIVLMEADLKLYHLILQKVINTFNFESLKNGYIDDVNLHG